MPADDRHPFVDINEPMGAPSAAEEDAGPAAEQQEEPAPDQAPAEVRLLRASWQPGPDGFACNRRCFVEVEVELLRDTARASLTGRLYSIYEGSEERIDDDVRGTIDRATGIARLPVTLWFGSRHHAAWLDNRRAPCTYVMRDIRHSRGENTLESERLEFPDQLTGDELRVRIEVDPDDPAVQDERFTLCSTDDQQSYCQERTVRDDQVRGDRRSAA